MERVLAIHPSWTSCLILREDGVAVHDLHGTQGTYQMHGTTLRVQWTGYGTEDYRKVQDMWVHEAFMGSFDVKIENLRFVEIYGKLFPASQLSVTVPDGNAEVSIRLGTTDIHIFDQVFINRGYDSPHLPEHAATIVDLGANTGFSAVFFAERYPMAKVIALEPDAANYEMLIRNTSRYGDRVVREKLAAWTYDGFISFATEDTQGRPLGAWGGQVVAEETATKVPCITMDSLIQRSGTAHVDILKVDIEGAEKELFENSAPWLDRVNFVIAETHDRFKPGSEKALRDALAGKFEELPPKGEGLYFKRIA